MTCLNNNLKIGLDCTWLNLCLMPSPASIDFYKLTSHSVWSKFSLECSPVNSSKMLHKSYERKQQAAP